MPTPIFSRGNDFFTNLMRWSTARENTFTECLAASLADDPFLCRAFVRRLGGKVGVDETPHVVTQVRPTRDICLDLVLQCERQRIGLENKLFAREGKGQLKKYLTRARVDRLAFVTGNRYPIEQAVLQNPRYLSPENEEHFLWHDFYDMIEARAQVKRPSPFVTSLQQVFITLGFEPPLTRVGDLQSTDEAERTRARRHFWTLWGTTRQNLGERKWKIRRPGSIAQVYVEDGPKGPLEWALLDPIHPRGSVKVRLNIVGERARNAIFDLLHSQQFAFATDAEVSRSLAVRANSTDEVIDVRIAQRRLFSGARSDNEMQERLSDYVSSIFDICA
jgi:hypothetical protein